MYKKHIQICIRMHKTHQNTKLEIRAYYQKNSKIKKISNKAISDKKSTEILLSSFCNGAAGFGTYI